MKKLVLLTVSILFAQSSIAQNNWTQKPDFGSVARYLAVSFSIGTKGYIGTGYDGSVNKNDFWEYDQVANTWTQKANFGGSARFFAVGFSIGSKGYIGTGSEGGASGPFKNDFWEYDPVSNTWTSKANFAGTARAYSYGFSIGNKGYVGTGYDGSYRNDFWQYDPATDIWTAKANFGGGVRSNATGFSIGSKGYIGTGYLNGAKFNDFWEYDPITNIWTAKANFAGSPRFSASAFSIGSKGYIGTGSEGGDAGPFTNDFWEYDPATNIWNQKANFGGSARYDATGFSIGNKGYIGTGYDGSFKKDFWEYAPSTPGAALNFDGSDDYVNCGNSASLQINNLITIEAWVRPTVGTSRIMGKYANSLTSGWRFYYDGPNSHFVFGVSNGSTDHDLVSTVISALNVWHHIAGTYNKSTGELILYVDGVIAKETGYTTGVVLNTTDNVDLGRYHAFGDGYFIGDIDEVRIWSTVRTCDQINQLQNCELTGSETGLAAYYKFNQGTAGANNAGITTLTDATANTNNGTLTNFALSGSTSNWVAPGGITSGISCSGGFSIINYYPKTTNIDLSQPNNWTTDINGGVGSSPSDFTSAYQLFDVNRAGTVLNNWMISGGSNMRVTTTNGLVFGPAVRFTIGSCSTADFSNNPVVFRSTAGGIASLAALVGTLSNATNVTVERYISNKRAWRLLGIPFSASTQTIKTSWMENGSTSAGFGTQITTFTGDANAANFDAARPSSSIRTYSSDNFNSDGAHTPNTTNLITASQAYFLFVRGDRSVDRTTTVSPSSITTLRITGTIRQGNLAGAGITGAGFSLIQNPYPSSIDFDAIKGIAANSGITTFYVWDATLGTVGQYRTVQITGSSPFAYSATPGGANNNWRFIESGTAFFVAGNRTVDFTEATKSSGTPPSSMLRAAAGKETELVVNLYSVNADNTTTLADGVREVFDNTYVAAIDNNDAKKIAGFDLNLGIMNSNEILAIEKRPMPNLNDVISLNLSNALQGNYQFELQPANFSTSLFAYLRDNYLNTSTSINLTVDTKINFSITTDAASTANNRFSIVFAKTAISPVTPVIVIYPNPVQNGSVTLLLNNMPKGNYTVRLFNSLGQTVFSKQINHPDGSSIETMSVNKIKGAYMLEVTKPDNSKFTNKLIIN